MGISVESLSMRRSPGPAHDGCLSNSFLCSPFKIVRSFSCSPWNTSISRPALPRRQESFNIKLLSFIHTDKTPFTSRKPPLFAGTARGEEVISEADLYRYTRQRWLTNERNELAKRYLKFSLPHLVDVAVGVCKGARRCTKVLKLTEGLHNKAFALTMDNGMEVVAKLPNSNAGPTHYLTASEVATREMLRDIFSIPVPRILSWSCDAANNPVQAEYILEEKAPGVRLGAVWPSLPWKTKLAIVEQVADFDSSLTAVQFKTHGCIYFKEDLRRLTGFSDAVQFTADRRSLNLDQYAMGPLTKAELWASGREQMSLDRGPYFQTYMRGLGANETAWIQRFAEPRMNYYRSLEDSEPPRHGLELLAKYKRVAPFLVPTANESATANVLWHPDLHLDNMFVHATSYEITAILDWQSATVAPLFYQSGNHRAFRHFKSVREGWGVPAKPENFDALPFDKQKRVDRDLESETIHKYYEFQTMKRAPRHWEYLKQPMVPVLREPVLLVTGVWENRHLFFLRDSLITLLTRWNEMVSEDTHCPVMFSAEELEQHAQEEENIDGVGKMLSLLQEEGVMPADGMVEPEDYQAAVENCRKYKQIFLNAAENQYERELYSRIWPYQDVSDEI